MQQLMQGKSGASQIINRMDTEYYSGYASIEKTGWGVIVQTPTSIMKEPLRELIEQSNHTIDCRYYSYIVMCRLVR